MAAPTTTPGRERPAAATAHRRPARGQRSVPRSIALHGTLIAAAAVAVFPIAWMLFIALRPGNGWEDPLSLAGGLGFDNFGYVLGHTAFPHWLLNSLIVAAGTTVCGVLISASAGYAVSRMRFPGHRQLMGVFLVTQMFPMAVLIVPLYNILGSLGLLNSFGGLVLTYCSTAVPFCAWMLKGYFDTIPAEIDEAGRIDGLTPFGTFWRLIVPLARPGLAVTAFYGFLTAWSEVAFATQFLQSQNKITLAVGLQSFVSQYTAQWGYLMAASILITVPVGIVFLLVQRHLVTGLTAGGTKG